MRRFLTVFFLIIALAAPASARELTPDEKTALGERVEFFVAILNASDFENTLSITPPRIFAHIADQAGVTVEEVLTQTKAQIREVMGAVTIESFAAEFENVRYLETGDGTPYALIPTETTMSMPELGRVRTTSQTLALIDSGEWYLVRVDEIQQLLILREVYPEFVGVEFPSGSTQVLQ